MINLRKLTYSICAATLLAGTFIGSVKLGNLLFREQFREGTVMGPYIDGRVYVVKGYQASMPKTDINAIRRESSNLVNFAESEAGAQ